MRVRIDSRLIMECYARNYGELCKWIHMEIYLPIFILHALLNEIENDMRRTFSTSIQSLSISLSSTFYR